MTRHPLHTRVCSYLGSKMPIASPGMGGGARSELAAAVAKSAGYGMLGMVRELAALSLQSYLRPRLSCHGWQC